MDLQQKFARALEKKLGFDYNMNFANLHGAVISINTGKVSDKEKMQTAKRQCKNIGLSISQ